MKLRNKEHRDIIADFQGNWSLSDEGDRIVLKNDVGVIRFEYTSLEQLAKEWETFKEPLLYGDLKFAVKVWLDYCKAKPDDKVLYAVDKNNSRFTLYTKIKEGVERLYWFEMGYRLNRLEAGKIYSISDLVGEE